MKLESIVPVLWVTDILAAIHFYCDVLEFSCTAQIEGWASLERDGVELMLALPNTHLPFEKPHLTGSLYFRLNQPGQVDDLWQRIKDKVRVVYPVENFDYGMREFGIYDNNGYILNFGSAISDQVNRRYQR